MEATVQWPLPHEAEALDVPGAAMAVLSPARAPGPLPVAVSPGAALTPRQILSEKPAGLQVGLPHQMPGSRGPTPMREP